MTDEPKYTLAEARQKLAETECATYGHDWSIIHIVGNPDPSYVLCNRCGARRKIVSGSHSITRLPENP